MQPRHHRTVEWVVRRPDAAVVQRLTRSLKIPPLLALLLHNRDLADLSEARHFLAASLDHLHSAEELPGMERAAQRLADAVQGGERLAVYGDYDVDGTSGTALLVRFFRELGAPVTYHIPSRFEAGYGLNLDDVERLINDGARVLITVDCGTTNYAEVDHAQGRGVDVIVVDHHHTPNQPLRVTALVNPKLAGCSYPWPHLASVGLCFKLAHAVRRLLHQRGVSKLPNLKRSLDLVALGTIADLVPLRGENHTLVRHGLEELTQTKKVGVQALKEVSFLSGETINTGHVGFRLAPRLNAAGRMEDARLAVELMLTEDRRRAAELAGQLDALNRSRQETQEQIVEEALVLAEQQLAATGGPGLVVASQGWHIGIVGIVAARLAETFHQPTLVIAVEGAECRGSGRSVQGVDLYRALKECDDLFTKFGGHTHAVGFSMPAGYLDGLQRRFRKAVLAQVGEQPPGPKLVIDAEVELAALDFAFVSSLDRMAPFGIDNPAPVFCARGVTVLGEPRLMGREKQHVRLQVKQNATVSAAVGFNLASSLRGFDWRGRRADIVFRPNLNTWNGTTQVQLQLQDLRPAE
ncbi:MAG: single-stranded-DNA-specific exonuclease RecJ [Candidatus Tectomicrobia bacterium]|nr:single-stranded-DNA-specific exonuclease RecJ [Candidatus Tectomicrobia bacterium]